MCKTPPVVKQSGAVKARRKERREAQCCKLQSA
ncbi:uncharacterized, partial [Tachysurus ichikawai]